MQFVNTSDRENVTLFDRVIILKHFNYLETLESKIYLNKLKFSTIFPCVCSHVNVLLVFHQSKFRNIGLGVVYLYTIWVFSQTRTPGTDFIHVPLGLILV